MTLSVVRHRSSAIMTPVIPGGSARRIVKGSRHNSCSPRGLESGSARGAAAFLPGECSPAWRLRGCHVAHGWNGNARRAKVSESPLPPPRYWSRRNKRGGRQIRLPPKRGKGYFLIDPCIKPTGRTAMNSFSNDLEGAGLRRQQNH